MLAPTNAESRVRLPNDPIVAPLSTAVRGVSSAEAQALLSKGETGVQQGRRKGAHSHDQASGTARGVRTSAPQAPELPVPTAGDRQQLDQAGHFTLRPMSGAPLQGLIPIRVRHAMAEPEMTGA